MQSFPLTRQRLASRRLRSAFATAGIALSLALTGSPADAAAATADPADAASGWLARQMADGERLEMDFGGGMVFVDQGLTLDAVLAFDAAGVAGDNAGKAIAWLAKPDVLAPYIGDGADTSTAGAIAKMLLAALIHQKDPATFGGVDLPARLLALQADSGRFTDKGGWDSSNTFGQSLAVLALDRLPAGAPAKAVDFLAGTACGTDTDPARGFPIYFGQPSCSPDVDGTAMVVQALRAAGATDAADRGIAWLLSRQRANGSFASGGPGDPVENSNSTGLAAQALRAAGKDAAADKAVAYLRTLQVGCGGTAGERGAVAYDSNGFDPGNAQRATAQAILGLAGVGLAELDSAGTSAAAPTLECTVTPSRSAAASPRRR